MDVQVDFFNTTRKQFDDLLGKEKAKDYIAKKSIFSITIGANDFLNNYLFPLLSVGTRFTQTPDDFIGDMLEHLRDQLTVSNKILISIHQNKVREFLFSSFVIICMLWLKYRGCINWMRGSL